MPGITTAVSSLFNLSKDIITVGYIDPIRGYVKGVTVCEANEYAELNPGTTFIFIDGDGNTRYLRIKQVNELTAKDLLKTEECDPDFGKCGPPKIQIFGGGGVGARANPIISQTSGAIIAADLVFGGHGYAVEPFAQAIDPCNQGAGAVFETRVGIITTTDEVFDKEDDIEVYYKCPDLGVNPRDYGPEGEDRGEWNPDKYFDTNKDTDPIQQEIEKYQKFLKTYANPWWHSRLKSPKKITGNGKAYSKVYNVTHVGTGYTTQVIMKSVPVEPGPAIVQIEPPKPPSLTQEVEFSLYRSVGANPANNFEDGRGTIKFTFTPIKGEGQPFSFINDDIPHQKYVKKKITVYKNTVYKIEASITEKGLKLKPNGLVEQGTLDSKYANASVVNNLTMRGLSSNNLSRRNIKEFNQKSQVIFADILPTANDNNDFVISIPTGQGNFTPGKKTEISVANQKRNTYELEYVLEVKEESKQTQSTINNQNLPVVKASFVKKDDGIYLDATGYSGQIELDFKFLVSDSKEGKGWAGLEFEIPGTPIKYTRQLDKKGITPISRENITKKYTIQGGKLYGPVKFPGITSGGTFVLESDRTIAALDPQSASEYNKKKSTKGVERDFDVYIQAARALPGVLISETTPSGSRSVVAGVTTETFKTKTWNDFMNTYAVSPVPDSNLPGSDYANTLFTIEWEENFPYPGEYIFRGCRDNVSQLYIDNKFISDLQNFNQDPVPVPVQMTEGNHTIRVDLLNLPVMEKKVEQVLEGESVNTPKESKKETSTPSKSTSAQKKEVTFTITTKASFSKSFTIPELKLDVSKKENGEQLKGKTEIRSVVPGKVYTVIIGGRGDKKLKTSDKNTTLLVEDSDDNDYDDLVCRVSGGRFFNPSKNTCSFILDAPPDQSLTTQGSTSTPTPATGAGAKKIFNTVDYITKADRPLWRINPNASPTNGFLDRYGILPFDPNSTEAQVNSFVGTHVIRWEKINFPVDGYYRISVDVDDNVKIYIGNSSGDGRVEIGNGLTDIEKGGDETIIDYKGFSAPSTPKGQYTTTKYFKAGNYRIRAELEQIKGKELAKGNPMALAIDIETSYVETEVVAAKSWQQNPLGVALTIEAPLPPTPQEKPPAQVGRCPSNPFWTTRFPNAKQKWYPVRYNGYSVTTTDTKVDEFKADKEEVTPPSLTEEVELTLYRKNGKDNGGNIFVTFTPKEGEGQIITIDNDIPNGKSTKKKITIYKNTIYEITSGLTEKGKKVNTSVEQGTLELKNDSKGTSGGSAGASQQTSDPTPWVEKAGGKRYKEYNKESSVLFVDALPSANDNDDFVISLPKGKGQFAPSNKTKVSGGDQNRNTWKIEYSFAGSTVSQNQLKKKASTGASQNTTADTTTKKARFVKKNGSYYLDVTGFSGNVEIDLRYLIQDPKKGGNGFAALKFSVPGTSISFNRTNADRTKIIDADVTKKYIVKGGKEYGPIVFSGGAAKSTTTLQDSTTLVSLDPKSAADFNKKKSLNGIERDFDITILGTSPVGVVKEDKKTANTTQTEKTTVTKTTGWSKFTNRYAISPVPPLGSQGSDKAGITFSNTWDIEVPFTGFYGFKATADNEGRLLVDGEEVLKAEHFATDSPKTIKKKIEKGKHTITVEVYNKPQQVSTTQRKKIFSTQDWIAPAAVTSKTTTTTSAQQPLLSASATAEEYELVQDIYFGTGTTPIGPNPKVVGQRPSGMRGAAFIPVTAPANATFFSNSWGPWYLGTKLNIKAQVGGAGNLAAPDWGLNTDVKTKYHQWDENTRLTLGTYKGRIDEWGIKVWKKKTSSQSSQSSSQITETTTTESSLVGGLVEGVAKDGVIYEGPTLFGYKHSAWSDFMNLNSVSPVITTIEKSIKTAATVAFIKRGNNNDLYLDASGFSGVVEIDLTYKIHDSNAGGGYAALKFEVPGTPILFDRQLDKNVNVVNNLTMRGLSANNLSGKDIIEIKTIKKTYKVDGGKVYGPIKFTGGNEGKGVILESKSTIASYDNQSIKQKGKKERDFDVIIDGVRGTASKASSTNASTELIGDKTLIWRNVSFSESGQYLIEMQADNIATLKIGGNEIHKVNKFTGKQIPFFATISKGTYDVEIVLTNSPTAAITQTTNFDENPTGVACIISVDVTSRSISPAAWQDSNPMGVSAVMISPPCPKPTSGRGVVTEIIPTDPGNGYNPPQPGPPTYPVTLELTKIIPTNPGINYNCGVDELVIEPSNGAQATYSCDSFGRITNITVTNPGIGFTFLPRIDIRTSTGVNFEATPVLTPIRDPIGVPEQQLIQVTDLVGLKQTGYIEGRPYYGAVFYENGIKYAGYYKTVGDPVQVYDTLQESIDAQITTPPSAIQRSGTDIRSNDPRLNIPKTPENLTDLNQ